MRPQQAQSRQRLQRDQHGVARRLGQGVELRPVHELEPAARRRTHPFDALLQGLRRAVRGRHKPPYRQPGLAAARAHADPEADAGLPVSFPRSPVDIEGSRMWSNAARLKASRLPKRSNTERWETPARKATSPVFGILFLSPATLI